MRYFLLLFFFFLLFLLISNAKASYTTPQGSPGNLIGRAVGVNMALTSDQPITMFAPKYIINKVIATNAIGTPLAAAGGVYSAVAKGGSVITLATQLFTQLTASAKFLPMALTTLVGTDVRTESVLYFSLSIPNATALTADILVYGDKVP